MRKGIRAAVALIGLALASATASPIRPEARLSLSDMPLHDPWIVADRATRTYRLYTSNEPAMTGVHALGIMAYSSTDLRHWTAPRLIFRLPAGGWATGGAWAPEVHRWKGRWYLFATFHNDALPLPPGKTRHPTYRRGTVLAVADSLDGPFRLLRNGEPIAPSSLMTLDGTLYADPGGRPWLVFAHEWIQTGNGTIEALPLDDGLAAKGTPRVLFRAGDALWVAGQRQPDGDDVRVTDGPELFRTRTGRLLMLWSSYGAGGQYAEGLARSRSGTLAGPWEQLPPLLTDDSGHGMLFRAFDGRLLMIVHHPFRAARGRIYAMRDDGDRVAIVRRLTELEGAAP
jgi:beta-xylosidase